jgi:ribonucleoside-diphosphate reductase alpha chain
MQKTPFGEKISAHLWHTRFQYVAQGQPPEPSMEATWDRVALAVSSVEPQHRDTWRERFRALLSDFHFLPGAAILSNAGTKRRATLCDSFVAGTLEDSLQGIFNAQREAMLTLQAGGELGVDFSPLRPAGASAVASGGVASGPVTFLTLWDAAAAVLTSGSPRPGRMMATLRCDHPDIEAFIDAKIKSGRLPHTALSVAVTDAFMKAVEQDGPWPLIFPLGNSPVPPGGEVCERVWPGNHQAQLCLVHRRLPARALWDKLVEAGHTRSEPGLLFIDRINQDDKLWYGEPVAASAPNGDMPLPPYGTCTQGALNLTRFIKQPFSKHPQVDFVALKAAASIATRFLDNVHELSFFPVKAQEKLAHAQRRIGLGVTGLADMLLMLGLRYGSQASFELSAHLMAAVRDAAYQTSIALAQEKGRFAGFDPIKFGASPRVLALPRELQVEMATHGLRNSHLLAISATEANSVLANCISPGIAPVVAFNSKQQARGAEGQCVTFEVENAAWHAYKIAYGPQASLPPHGVEAHDVSADDQLRMMFQTQAYVDGATPSVVFLPPQASLQASELALRQAWELGLKGCKICRP